MFELVLQVAQLLERALLFRRLEPFHARFELMDARGNGFQLRNRVFRVFQQVLFDRMGVELLVQVANADVFGQNHIALVRLDIVADQPENRTLARPVGAHHTDPLAGVDPERHRLQHILRPEVLAHLYKIDHAFTKRSGEATEILRGLEE